VWGKAAELVSLVLLVTVVPRILGPGDYGSFALVLGLVLIGSTALSISGPAVMSRFVGAAPAEERASLARALALRALRWRVCGLAAAIAVGIALVAFDADRFRPFVVAIVLVAIALDAPATVAFQSALALGRVGAWSVRYPLQNLALVLVALALYGLAGADGALVGVPVSCAVAFVVGLVLCLKPLARAARTTIPRDVSRFALIQSWSNVLLVLQHRGAVVAAALLAASAAETGYAGLAAGVAIAATYAVWQLFTVTLPRFAASADSDPLAVEHALRRVTGLLLVIAGPAALLGVALVGTVVGPLFGSEFSGAKAAFIPALAVVPLAPLTGAVASLSAVRLRPGARLVTMIVGAVTFVAAAVVLVPIYDSTGATVALLAGTIASACCGFVFFRDVLDDRLLAASLVGVGAVLVVGVVT
jgi:O-antigen/teichoic acid export membrane protein